MATKTVNSNSIATATSAIADNEAKIASNNAQIETLKQQVPSLSSNLASMLVAAKRGSDRYVISARQAPVVSGVLIVSLTEVTDLDSRKRYQVVAAKPSQGGRAVVLGSMYPHGMEVCPSVVLNGDITSAIAKANNTWADSLKAEAKKNRLDAKLDAIASYFDNSANGAFVEL